MNHKLLFKQIVLGGVNREQLLDRLFEKNIQLNEYAKTLLTHRSFYPEVLPESTVKLAKVSASDLSIQGPVSLDTVIQRGLSLGLKPCPLHLAAFLRLQYLDQPVGAYLTVVSHQPERDDEYPSGFYIRNWDGSLWLRGYRPQGECEWPGENEFVFLL